jgi:hypothetical protein
MTMTRIAVSRRNLLATGACALVNAVSLSGPASTSASGAQNSTKRGGSPEVVRSLGEERLGPSG